METKKEMKKMPPNTGYNTWLFETLKSLFPNAIFAIPKKRIGSYDFSVEIPNPLTNIDKRLIHGFKFLVLAKAVDKEKDSVVVESDILKDALSSSKPVMLIFVRSKALYYIWLDEKLKEILGGKIVKLAKKQFE